MTTRNAGTGDNDLYGVAAISAGNVWAVGEYFVGVNTRTLIEHWNGKSWKIVPSPNLGTVIRSTRVYAVSAANVWAAGSYYNGTAGRTLIEHWNGKSWKVVHESERRVWNERGVLGTGHVGARHLGCG